MERENVKYKYAEFCKTEVNIPVFSQPWWLDVVCGEKNWDVILIERGNNIIASFPYYFFISKGMRHIGMPVLTQKLGPYIKYPEGQKYVSRLSYEKEIMQEIIDRLPGFDAFNVHFDYHYQNWLPFYWNDFKQTTRYTYVIEDISDIDKVVASFDARKKRHLKKGIKSLTIKYDLPVEKFIQYYKDCLKKRGKILSYSDVLLYNLCVNAYLHNQGRIIYVVDDLEQIHGVIFYVWDGHAAYDLVTAFNPDFGDSGASTYLVYQIIKDSSIHCRFFDFEGSMVEEIESSYHKFGTIQKPYFYIYKANSRRYKLMHAIKGIVNVVRN